MADDGTGTDGTQDAPEVENPETSQQTPNPTEEGQAPEAEEFDKERALSLIRKQRQELKDAAKAQKELDELRRYREDAETAKLSELERHQKKAADLEAALERERQAGRDRETRLQVQIAAQSMNIVDPDAAVKLLDWSQVEDGDVTAALRALVEDKPYLVRQDQPRHQPGSPTNPATRSTPEDSRIWTAAEIADPVIWKANKDKIIRALREERVTD